jgi:hypothetical protein
MPADPNANVGFMIAAYAVTAVLMGGYGLALWLKARRTIGR